MAAPTLRHCARMLRHSRVERHELRGAHVMIGPQRMMSALPEGTTQEYGSQGSNGWQCCDLSHAGSWKQSWDACDRVADDMVPSWIAEAWLTVGVFAKHACAGVYQWTEMTADLERCVRRCQDAGVEGRCGHYCRQHLCADAN